MGEWNRRRSGAEGILDLRDIDLTSADLRNADLSGARLDRATLVRANLSGAILDSAVLAETKLDGSCLIGALLSGAVFAGSSLRGTDFSDASCKGTVFSDTDLSECLGLDTVKHAGPSDVGVACFFRLTGRIPEAFLRGCGVPESLIVYLPSLVAASQPIQFYSCFLSFSYRDRKFVDKLYRDLRDAGVRCWYAPEDIQGGRRLHEQIDEAIRVYDKLIVVLSKHSLNSSWIEMEVQKALERERKDGRTTLFAIRTDDCDPHQQQALGEEAAPDSLYR